MITRERRHPFLVLAVGFLLVSLANGTVEASCDIEDVCKHVTKIKKELIEKSFPPKEAEGLILDGKPPKEREEPVLDVNIKRQIKKKCKKEWELFACAFDDVVTWCWDEEKNTADVIKQCKDD